MIRGFSLNNSSDGRTFAMNCGTKALLSLLFIGVSATLVTGHGILLDPPSRASAWRAGFDTPKDYSDMNSFCGGFERQWLVNHGRCGICGDAYDEDIRPHEAPRGLFATGTLVRNYTEGQQIPIFIATFSHFFGYYEFKLCPNNNTAQDPEQECFEMYPLRFADADSFRYTLSGQPMSVFNTTLQLPEGITCSQCIIQWTFWSEHRWGICANGTYGRGCGPQETFRACADVSIHFKEPDMVSPVPTTVVPTPPITTPTTIQISTTTTTRPTTTPPVETTTLPPERATLQENVTTTTTTEATTPTTEVTVTTTESTSPTTVSTTPTTEETTTTTEKITITTETTTPTMEITTPTTETTTTTTELTTPTTKTTTPTIETTTLTPETTTSPANATTTPLTTTSTTTETTTEPTTEPAETTTLPTNATVLPTTPGTEETALPTTPSETTTPTVTTTDRQCFNFRSVGTFAKMSGGNAWCQSNCSRGYCPPTFCACVDF